MTKCWTSLYANIHKKKHNRALVLVMYCTTPDYLTVTDAIISHAARMKILC